MYIIYVDYSHMSNRKCLSKIWCKIFSRNDEMDEVRWCISFDENECIIYTDDILYNDLDKVDDMSWYDEVVVVL